MPHSLATQTVVFIGMNPHVGPGQWSELVSSSAFRIPKTKRRGKTFSLVLGREVVHEICRDDRRRIGKGPRIPSETHRLHGVSRLTARIR